jgi:hypothetical protein
MREDCQRFDRNALWSLVNESQRFDLRFKGTMTGCPECGLKHLLGPCYGGFHPDDDFGSAPGGG